MVVLAPRLTAILWMALALIPAVSALWIDGYYLPTNSPGITDSCFNALNSTDPTVRLQAADNFLACDDSNYVSTTSAHDIDPAQPEGVTTQQACESAKAIAKDRCRQLYLSE